MNHPLPFRFSLGGDEPLLDRGEPRRIFFASVLKFAYEIIKRRRGGSLHSFILISLPILNKNGKGSVKGGKRSGDQNKSGTLGKIEEEGRGEAWRKMVGKSRSTGREIL
jgi:hypothetical protein